MIIIKSKNYILLSDDNYIIERLTEYCKYLYNFKNNTE